MSNMRGQNLSNTNMHYIKVVANEVLLKLESLDRLVPMSLMLDEMGISVKVLVIYVYVSLVWQRVQHSHTCEQ